MLQILLESVKTAVCSNLRSTVRLPSGDFRQWLQNLCDISNRCENFQSQQIGLYMMSPHDTQTVHKFVTLTQSINLHPDSLECVKMSHMKR